MQPHHEPQQFCFAKIRRYSKTPRRQPQPAFALQANESLLQPCRATPLPNHQTRCSRSHCETPSPRFRHRRAGQRKLPVCRGASDLRPRIVTTILLGPHPRSRSRRKRAARVRHVAHRRLPIDRCSWVRIPSLQHHPVGCIRCQVNTRRAHCIYLRRPGVDSEG